MRDGIEVSIGQEIEFDGKLKLCVAGLHASMKISDSKRFAPENSVLTKVSVWGKIIFDKDKLVATNRMILEEIRDENSILQRAK